MANWIEGTLKLRGSSENLKAFFEDAILPCASKKERYNKDDFITFHLADDWYDVDIRHDAWIKGTQRAFVNDDCSIEVEVEDGYDSVTVCLPIRQAWSFEADDWKNISDTYNLDVRLYGFERGMEFCQEVEVVGGQITMDRKINYDDWKWECPMPNMGG
jgi:hypothetical protein